MKMGRQQPSSRKERLKCPVTFPICRRLPQNRIQHFQANEQSDDVMENHARRGFVFVSLRNKLKYSATTSSSFQLPFVLPQPILELREEFERVVTHDLTADSIRVFFDQVAAIDFLGQHFGDALASDLGRAINPFAVVADRASYREVACLRSFASPL